MGSKTIYINDGELNFNKKVPFGSGTDITRSVSVSDINKDGFLDIICANIGEPNFIYFGDSIPSFKKR